MNHSTRSIPVLAVLIAALSHPAHSTDHNFCGESWEDASSSCQERQYCPSGSDDECTVAGQICFADTLCDASKGDGVQAGSVSLAAIVDIPYDDLSNRMFCGSWWATSQENCSLDTFCGHDENTCKDFTQCYETQCHLQDLAAKELGENWKDVLIGGGTEKPEKLSHDDPRRHNFCGTDWADADSKCNHWCLGEDTDCPPGLGCFSDTSCFYDDDIMPTLSPTVSPPTTDAPVTADDPINSQFCGETWESAIKSCSIETNCKFDSDCPENHVCYGYLPNCNLSEMAKEAAEPEQESVRDDAEPVVFKEGDPSNNSFCGSDWVDAVDNCSLDTHCPDNVCSDGKSCFQFIQSENCDAYKLMMATAEPSSAPSILTNSPTRVATNAPTLQPPTEPTKQPTDQPIATPTNAPTSMVSGLCASDLENLQKIYRYATMCSIIDPCPDNLTCFDSIDYATLSKTKKPTKEPSRRPSTRSPTLLPTNVLSSMAPVLSLHQQDTPEPTHSTNSDVPMPAFLPLVQPESIAPTYSTLSKFPTHAPRQDDDVTISSPTHEKKFYCAIDERELEVSCDWALECTDGNDSCPEGYNCIQYDCEQPYKPSPPDLCPMDFVGFISNGDLDCKMFYECKNGLLGAANTCTDGLKYDIFRQMCWYEDEVDSNCFGHPIDPSEPTWNPSARPTYFFNVSDPELCPMNVVGSFSNNDVDCKLYYECNNGTLGDVKACIDGHKYDIDRQMCVSEDEVDSNCFGHPIDAPEPTWKPSSRPTYFLNASDPELCPINVVASYSTGDVGCKLYYECNNGTLGRVNTCTDGLKYDIVRQMCWYEDEVDSNCYGPPMKTPEPTWKPSSRPTYFFNASDPELCPMNFVGAMSTGNVDCKLYFKCNNGTLGDINTCTDGLKYDIVRQMCWYEDEVDSKCYGPPISPDTASVSEPQSTFNTSNIGSESPNDFAYKCLENYTGWAVYGGCKQYYWCTNGTVSGDVRDCGEGLFFDLNHGICMRSDEILCNETVSTFPEELSSLAASNRYVWPEEPSSNGDDNSPNIGQWHLVTQAFLENPAVRWASRTKALVWVSGTLLVYLILNYD